MFTRRYSCNTGSSANLRVSPYAGNNCGRPTTLLETLGRIGHATGWGLHDRSVSSSVSSSRSGCSYVLSKDGFSFGRMTAANPRGLNLFGQLLEMNLAKKRKPNYFKFIDKLGGKFVEVEDEDDEDDEDDEPSVRRRFARASVASSGPGQSHPGSSFWADSVASSGPGESHPSDSFWDD
jgi:hypothetical protein